MIAISFISRTESGGKGSSATIKIADYANVPAALEALVQIGDSEDYLLPYSQPVDPNTGNVIVGAQTTYVNMADVQQLLNIAA